MAHIGAADVVAARGGEALETVPGRCRAIGAGVSTVPSGVAIAGTVAGLADPTLASMRTIDLCSSDAGVMVAANRRAYPGETSAPFGLASDHQSPYDLGLKPQA